MTADSRPAGPQLSEAYRHRTYDPLQATDLLHDEILQRRESGYDVDAVIERANATDPTDRAAVLALVDGMADLERRSDWAFEEPDSLEDIQASLPSVPRPSPHGGRSTRAGRRDLADQISAAWLGRIAGCNVGKPVESGLHWTVERIRDYLERAGAYPLANYFPVLHPMPAGFELLECWPDTTRDALERIRRAYGHYSWVHTINNAAVVVAGLLWGEGDYMSALGKTVMSGWDTDSNGATVGSVAGVLAGTADLPARLIEPLHDRTRSALFGFDNSRISDLAGRTLALATGGLSAGTQAS